MLYYTDLVETDLADDTDIMTSNLKYCPVDNATDKKKKYYLSAWYLENSTYGGAGDPTVATKAFGEKIHKETVNQLIEVIKEFYDITEKLKNRKLNRKCNKF